VGGARFSVALDALPDNEREGFARPSLLRDSLRDNLPARTLKCYLALAGRQRRIKRNCRGRQGQLRHRFTTEQVTVTPPACSVPGLSTHLRNARSCILYGRYRLSRFGGTEFTPETLPTRFNPGAGQYPGFSSLALAEDITTATFELTTSADLATTAALLRSQISVALTNVTDLTDPPTVESVLGIDFAALMGMSFPGEISVTQKICAILAESGSEGAIFPSRTTLGGKNLAVFRSNLPGGRPLTALCSAKLATDEPSAS
jgi:RES domain-containing protein